MLPTFSTFTDRHPRAVAVFGVALFVIGFTLWAEVTFLKSTNTPQETTQTSDEAAIREQLSVLESLKTEEDVVVTNEEQMAALELLKVESTEETTISSDEQLEILSKLKVDSDESE